MGTTYFAGDDAGDDAFVVLEEAILRTAICWWLRCFLLCEQSSESEKLCCMTWRAFTSVLSPWLGWNGIYPDRRSLLPQWRPSIFVFSLRRNFSCKTCLPVMSVCSGMSKYHVPRAHHPLHCFVVRAHATPSSNQCKGCVVWRMLL